jgi:hypothetical protein
MNKLLSKPAINGNEQPSNRHVKYCLYLVLNHNHSRSAVEAEKRQYLLQELITFSGGVTRLPPCQEWWISNASQKICEDRVTVIEVIVTDSIKSQLFFLTFAAKVARMFEQEHVLVTRQPVESLSIDLL